MNRPAPRRSSLTGSSPVTPPPPAESETTQPEAPTPVAAARSSSTSPTKAGTTKYPPKVSFYQDPADTARMRAAIIKTMANERFRNLSQFVNEAVMEKVEHLEQKYNGGQPFGSTGAGELPQGRPMGE